MNGITVLYEYMAAPMNGILWAIFSMLLLLVILFYSIANNHHPISAIVAIIMIFVGCIIAANTTKSIKRAEIIVDDTVSFNEVMDQYSVRERKGDLWVMEIIEKKE